jgi:rSAM/selenodomain-associated transferase 1
MEEVNDKCILFFIKYPQVRKVKQRLAKDIGQRKAVKIYKMFISDMLEMLSEINADVIICYSPKKALQKLRKWLGSKYEYVAQEGTSLGSRMNNCFIKAFNQFYSKAIVVGSDLPDLPKKFIEDAYRMLDEYDSVIGPSEDGGYYMLGFKAESYLSSVFDYSIKWSTKSVFTDSLGILQTYSYNVGLLPMWYDVDTVDDLKRLYQRHKNENMCSLDTISYLKQGKVRQVSTL